MRLFIYFLILSLYSCSMSKNNSIWSKKYCELERLDFQEIIDTIKKLAEKSEQDVIKELEEKKLLILKTEIDDKKT